MSVYFENPFKGNNVKDDIKALNKRCFYLEKELEEYKKIIKIQIKQIPNH